jgi:hypothetical protein
VTIGAPGNRATIPSEVPSNPGLEIGAVAYEFRLTRTEATVEQYAQFANAYLRWNPQRAMDNEVWGRFLGPTGDGRVQYLPEYAHYPVQLSWRMAARWCNWLHNEQADRADAFENGAYDTSTFVTTPGGVVLDQLTRSPGARFWIPSRDEWTKGAYYDPHRYGPGAGGYWLYPHRSNDEPRSGLSSLGGQTNAGEGVPVEFASMNVGSYPDVQSAWGLLDLSGGASEWSEWTVLTSRDRVGMGSTYRDFGYTTTDQIAASSFAGAPWTTPFGLRVASVIPAPSALVVVSAWGMHLFARTRRTP